MFANKEQEETLQPESEVMDPVFSPKAGAVELKLVSLRPKQSRFILPIVAA
jgi:hypothetical protein